MVLQDTTALIRRAFHEPGTRSYAVAHGSIYVLIFLSVLLFLAEIPFGEVTRENFVLYYMDRAILWLFLGELTLRILSFHPPSLEVFRGARLERLRRHVVGRLRFCLRPLILVDIVTVSSLIPALRGLRAVRLLRLLYTTKVFRYSNPYLGLIRSFQENKLLFSFAFSLLGVATLLGGVSIFLIEGGTNPTVDSLGDGIWWALVTVTTVGFGDISPVTTLGRVIGGILMITGMFNLALFAGIVSHSILRAVLSMREEQFRMSATYNHLVICGYDSGARMLLNAIREEVDLNRQEILLFSEGDRPSDLPPEFSWVSGDPTKESELDKVRLSQAGSVIIVGSRTAPPQHADATTILTIFTIRSYLRGHAQARERREPLYVVAEILEAENVEHARSAGANEVIETTRLGFSLLAHACVMPGTSSVMSRVVTAGELSVFVGRHPDPDRLPAPFDSVARDLKNRYGAILIGLSKPSGDPILNPDPDHEIRSRSRLIYLAEKPVLKGD